MLEGHAVRRAQRLLLHLGDHLVQPFGDSDSAMIQSALALVRTIFEDHYVDPEHNTCLFFHGCTLAGSHVRSHDFNVVHRGDRVILSEFTFPHGGPAVVALSLRRYVTEVTRFGEQVLGSVHNTEARPEWQQRYLHAQREGLRQLLGLAQRFLDGDCQEFTVYCSEYHALQGHLKRPLELQVLDVLEGGVPRQPVRILSRILFGPLRAGEMMPMRLNRGDVVLVTVNQFTNEGVDMMLEGVGSGGIRPGDRLFGLQLFYP